MSSSPHSVPTKPQWKGIPSPFDTLTRPLSVALPVETRLLASKTRPDGGIEELYHEVPCLDGHKGAIFYVSDTPISGANKGLPTHERVLYTMVPRSGSEQFVSNIIDSFNRSPLSFEDCFTNTFKGQLLAEYPKRSE